MRIKLFSKISALNNKFNRINKIEAAEPKAPNKSDPLPQIESIFMTAQRKYIFLYLICNPQKRE